MNLFKGRHHHRDRGYADELEAIERAVVTVAATINKRLTEVVEAIKAEGAGAGRPHFEYTVGPVSPKRRKTMPLEVQTTVEEQILVTVHPKTNAGRPAEIDGPIRVSVISGDGTFEVQPDGRSYQSISTDTPGDTSLLVEADADLGEGNVLIQDTTIHHSIGANATNLGQEAGAITPKPVARAR